MKDHRARSMGDTASAVGSMLLFVLFAVCMLMAVARRGRYIQPDKDRISAVLRNGGFHKIHIK